MGDFLFGFAVMLVLLIVVAAFAIPLGALPAASFAHPMFWISIIAIAGFVGGLSALS